jgi:hypothetical protein
MIRSKIPFAIGHGSLSHARAVKFSFTWRIFNVSRLSEMNYAEKRLVIPTNRYFQLQSRREFGFM